MRFKRWGTYKKELSTIFLVIVICFFTLNILSFYSFSIALKDSIRRTIIYRVAENADFIKREIEGLKKSIEGVSLTSEMKTMDWEKQKSILLQECRRLDVKSFRVAHPDGNSRSTTGMEDNIINTDYFKQAKRGVTVLTDPIKDTWDDSLTLICATPIHDNSRRIVGVLIASMEPRIIYRTIESRKIGRTGYGFIVNKHGEIIAHPQYKTMESLNSFNSQISNNPDYDGLLLLIDRMTLNEIGSGFYKMENMEMFMAFAPILNTNWSLSMTVPNGEIFNNIVVMRGGFVTMSVILLIITILFNIMLYGYNSQNKRIQTLREDAYENQKKLKESLEMDRLRTEFFSNISHELRTPLNVILATLQLVNLQCKENEHISSEKIIKHNGIILKNCQRSIRLVNNLLDIIKIDAGFYEISLKNHNIVKIVEEITVSVSDYVQGKGIQLYFNSEAKQKVIACDMDKIERIFLNLLSNAVKFTNKGGSIYVHIYETSGQVAVSIRDTGIGIPEDKIDCIFQRFHQVDKSLTRNHEGSGIGLAIVKSLVEMHGGSITVSSKYGEGSEFIVELPSKVLKKENNKLEGCDTYNTDRIKIELSDIYYSK